jgi:hypothetical protein
MTSKTSLRRLAASLALAAAFASCSALKDKEPFTATVIYDLGPGGRPYVHPLEFKADTSYGQVTVVNNTAELRGFAIDELAVYEIIPAGHSRIVNVQEAHQVPQTAGCTSRPPCHTYVWYDQKHTDQFHGKMNVHFVSEQER